VTATLCYEGKASVLGMAETVKISLLAYDSTKSTGMMNIHATGISPEDCKNTAFTKTGQDITFNEGCLSGAQVSAKYCSDQDTISVSVTAHGFPIKVPATLTKTTC